MLFSCCGHHRIEQSQAWDRRIDRDLHRPVIPLPLDCQWNRRTTIGFQDRKDLPRCGIAGKRHRHARAPRDFQVVAIAVAAAAEKIPGLQTHLTIGRQGGLESPFIAPRGTGFCNHAAIRGQESQADQGVSSQAAGSWTHTNPFPSRSCEGVDVSLARRLQAAADADRNR